LLQVSQWFELVVFTASMEIYGTAVADKLDGEQGMLRRRYYRQHCTLDFGSYTKDLSAICSDLASVFILDNSPGAYRAYPGTFLSLGIIVQVLWWLLRKIMEQKSVLRIRNPVPF
jgi:TFIIF-interacting CTD phosphatase-like protein